MNLNQVTLKSSDVDCAVKFYQKLGFQLIVDSSPRYVRFACPDGDSTFSISHTQTVKQDLSTVLYFEVDDVDGVYENLSAKGIRFSSQPEDKRWLWREVSLNDPDGHPLILFCAGKTRKNPPWRLPT